MNPNWIELSTSGQEDQIEFEVKTSNVPDIELPAKLWGVIQAATGWFKVNDDLAEKPIKANA
jgi:hypothetical protein